MPSWGEILIELQTSIEPTTGTVDLDGVRRKYLANMAALTGRSVVLYATDFLGSGGPGTQVTLADMQGLMEVFRNLPGPNLDLILHSPGGEAEATERLVRYMRSKFDHVRVFVPLAAMSAATMWAMAADEIVMGKHSQLGPIDPQIGLPPNGMSMPAGALLEQFKQATDECAADPTRITGWLPTLQQYPPGLLNVCESAAALSKKLVAEWLQQYMLKGQTDAVSTANGVANWLADDREHLSHSRALTRDDLRSRGLVIKDLEESQALQDAVLSVHHATMHTLSGSAVKIIENNLGHAYVQHGGQVIMQPAPVPQPAQQPVPAAPPPSPSGPNRAERRRQQRESH